MRAKALVTTAITFVVCGAFVKRSSLISFSTKRFRKVTRKRDNKHDPCLRSVTCPGALVGGQFNPKKFSSTYTGPVQ